MFTHILFPTDGSALSNVALTKAALLAKQVGAKLTAMHVVGQYHPAVESDGYLVSEGVALLKQSFEKEEAARADRILDEVRKISARFGVECACVTASGDLPYQAIIAEASKSGCDLIVMASHGRRGLEGLLLGSETQKVLTHSKVPVLVCR